MKDFKEILNKQIKLTARTQKIVAKVQERRRLLFQDKLVMNPSDLAKQNHLLLEKFNKVTQKTTGPELAIESLDDKAVTEKGMASSTTHKKESEMSIGEAWAKHE